VASFIGRRQPESGKMDNKFKEIQKQLERERSRLTEELNSKLGESGVEGHEGSPFGKREETATESFQLEGRLAGVRHIQEQLAQIKRALEKLAKGTYGLCDSCGKPIPPARLEAMPQANLCVECRARQTAR
jgi:DnaK suppressor protein